jgi:hypothetical protein
MFTILQVVVKGKRSALSLGGLTLRAALWWLIPLLLITLPILPPLL